MRWPAAALGLAGGLCGAAGALVAAVAAAASGAGDAAWWVAAGGVAAALILGVPLGFLAAGRREAELRRLMRTVHAWSDGRLSERVEQVESRDLADLAAACNDLADAVQERLRRQRRAADADAQLARQGAELAALQERQRIARDLHDSVSQRLFGIHLLAAAAARDAGAGQTVRDLEALSREAQAEMRALLLQLRPPGLVARPLPEALADLCAAAERTGPPAWRVEIAAVDPLGPAVEEHLFRVAQEAVANVRRHAQARRATLALHAGEGRVVLAVDDDGRGFDPGSAGVGRLGLQGMRERVAAVGGTLRVTTQPGRGTRVEAVVPVVAGGAAPGGGDGG